MHILVIPSWYPLTAADVTGSFFREQALALKNSGQKVGVIYPVQAPITQLFSKNKKSFTNSIEDDCGIPTFRCKSIGWLPKVPYGNCSLWVKKGHELFRNYILEHGMPDIVHAHSCLYAGVLAASIKKEYNIPFVITEHNSAFARSLVKGWKKIKCQAVVSTADYKIAVSEQFVSLLDSFFWDSEPWNYLPNILSKRFADAEVKIDKNQCQNFTFCNVSFLNKNKGIDILISAFAKAFKGDCRFQLEVGGSGPLLSELKCLAKRMGVREQVKFLGLLSRNEVLDLMRKSNSYVMSSHVETFGIVAIESLSLGRPVIATRCGGPESIVRPQDGYLVQKDNIDDLAIAMKMLYENYSSFDSSEIRRSCLERFGEESVIKSLVDIYRFVLGK
jgi:glycosyltransferase involved in cell wall biosynthesis